MRRAYRSFALFFLTYPAFVAAALAKICPLNNAPVPLEYDEAKGEFSLLESSIENKEEGGDRTTDEEVRLLERAVLRTVQVAGSKHKRHLRARREEVKQVYMATSCPCGGNQETYCLVEGVSGSVHDHCGLTHSALTLFSNTTSIYNAANTKVECFKLESHTVFIRNVWPVIVFWYLALAVFLVATENGKNVRQYVLSKLCPRCRINERLLDSIMQRELEHRERIRAAATRAVRLADGRGRYLLRTRAMRVPPDNDGLAVGDEAMRRWIAQAESLGIILHTPMPTEYVLQTRKFNAELERTRREKARLEKALTCDAPLTPTKIRRANQISTPETVATCEEYEDDDVIDEGSEGKESDVSKKQLNSCEREIMQVDEQYTAGTGNEDESFDCTICLAPVEDGEQVGILSCNHLYHSQCLGQWIQRRNVCPLCQTEIATPRAVVEEEGNGEDAVVDRLNAEAPRSSNASEHMQLSFLSPVPNRTQRSRNRLQLQSQSQQRRRRHEVYIYSP